MNNVMLIFAGLLIGMLLFATALFCYILVSTVGKLTDQVKRLSETLGPVLDGGELLKLFKAVRYLGEQGETIGKKMDSLSTSLGMFCQIILARQESTPAAGGESAVFHYNEEEAAARSISAKARAAGIETEESRVSTSPSETLPQTDVY